jgi:hypothetical protein
VTGAKPAISVKGEVIDLWYYGKAHTHGGNIQAVLAPLAAAQRQRQT